MLGGPQAGLVVGRADLIAMLAKNPLKRALRLDKIRLAALEAVLRLYADPDRLAARLPALRLLARPRQDIAALAQRLLPKVAQALAGAATVEPVDTRSQIGSGALPVSLLPSAGLALKPLQPGGNAAEALARRLRQLPVPVIGRIEAGRVILDLRCLEDEAEFAATTASPGGGRKLTPMPRLAAIGLLLLTLAVPAAAQAPGPITITVRDHKFEPSEVSVPAGVKAELVIRNEQKTPAEFESHSLKREKVIRARRLGENLRRPAEAGPLRVHRRLPSRHQGRRGGEVGARRCWRPRPRSAGSACCHHPSNGAQFRSCRSSRRCCWCSPAQCGR